MHPVSYLLSTSIAGLAAFTALPALARPFIYMGAFSYTGRTDTCINQARQTLINHGFQEIRIDDSGRSQKSLAVYGYHATEAVTAQIECHQKLGITTLGVAGTDNDATYQIYDKLYKAEW